MKIKIDFIENGTVTSVKGFKAGAVNAGIKKKSSKPDLGIIYSETPCTAAGVFTRNKIKAAPVIVCQNRLPADDIQVIIANSGCANAVSGQQGMKDALEMAALAAKKTRVNPASALVASTGVIGRNLPMDIVKQGIVSIELSENGGHDFARAIMTTDTVSKEIAISVNDGLFTIGGVAKGSGMIHPDMGTMLCFITTDAAVDKDFLSGMLRTAADVSFNMVSVDTDTSTNDTMIIMANGLAYNDRINEKTELAEAFQEALNEVCTYLAKAVAADGEGASKLIEVNVTGALDIESAKICARTIAASPLVKTAIHGCDPNWGRIIAAAGRSGAEVVEEKTDLSICGISLLKKDSAIQTGNGEVSKAMAEKIVVIDLNLNLGKASATAWGCDLTAEYVSINADYTT
ncbi:MAG: bifunctional glutamate N-acetyltransferase/amino-acid acetyltransferase ArgJ [Dehalococcoidales bacterium]|nr:bifunctional glutamate N-acetyltransferase/amino-acid acetyltransferase ArgJ [Dehalococcoidales bacterium]